MSCELGVVCVDGVASLWVDDRIAVRLYYLVLAVASDVVGVDILEDLNCLQHSSWDLGLVFNLSHDVSRDVLKSETFDGVLFE